MCESCDHFSIFMRPSHTQSLLHQIYEQELYKIAIRTRTVLQWIQKPKIRISILQNVESNTLFLWFRYT